MTEIYIRQHVIPTAYALLPAGMTSPKATAMLMAIGLQESRFTHRRQISGPARGFFQFERAGIAGVLKHRATAADAHVACSVLCYPATVDACHAAVEHNDVLAAVFARLLLWTVPASLPDRDDPDSGWEQYLEGWRPGRPHRQTWNGFYAAGWAMKATEGERRA
jgi:hypothetical protein